MAIETVFQQLVGLLGSLSETLEDLALTAIEDRPARGQVLLVERLGDLIEALRGWSEETQENARQARVGVTYPVDFNRARQALGRASENFIRLKNGFYGEAVTHGTIEGLRQFGRERGREWLSWSGGMVQALDGCRPGVDAVDAALLQAWQELTERLAARSVSVQTTNIGQQISAAQPQTQSLVKDEFT